MPWNDASKPPRKPGPWETPADGERSGDSATGKPNQTGGDPPWGRQPSASKPRPARSNAPGEARKDSTPPPRGPHLDELSRQLRMRLASAALRPSNRRLRISLVAGGVGLVAVVWALSGLYRVHSDEAGVITRFGATVRQVKPGLHYHLPFPFEAVRRLPLGVEQLALGSADGDDASGRMLTRDGDLVSPAYTVQWRIGDAKTYLAGLADPGLTLRLDAASALRETLGQLTLSQALAADHGDAGAHAQALLQTALDRDKAGVRIVDLQIHDMAPPGDAQSGFRDISTADGEAQVDQRQAEAYRVRVVTAAKADAAKLVQTSQGYRDQEVSEAKGEAARFALIDAQYRKTPQATRDRLYTETMERVLHNVPKVIIPSAQAGSPPIVLPSELFRPRAADPAAQPPSASPAPAGPAA